MVARGIFTAAGNRHLNYCVEAVVTSTDPPLALVSTRAENLEDYIYVTTRWNLKHFFVGLRDVCSSFFNWKRLRFYFITV